MKAQMSRTAEIYPSPSGDPTTPVIIKIGGGDPPEAPSKPQISSEFVPFADDSGEVWRDADSTFLGRIQSLTIQDGPLLPLSFAVTPRPDAFVTLDLTLAIADEVSSFLVSEKQKDDAIVVNAQSPAGSFRITQGSPNNWRTSEAEFLAVGVKLVFTQSRPDAEVDDCILEYVFNNPDDFRISLGFLRTP